jgi:predicted ArsR family transcriptional regulator
MQQTRRFILDILREQGEATVDEIVAHLQQRRGRDITPVTVRHHISLLQQERLVTSLELRRRHSPGRPQHVYALTEKAKVHFPHNYERLLGGLVAQIEKTLPPDTVNVIFEGIADDMASHIPVAEHSTLEERLICAVKYLNESGYEARWEAVQDGYLLHTRNCPYHGVAHDTTTLCALDIRLVAKAIGVIPRLVSRITLGDPVCSYWIAAAPAHNVNGHHKN